MLDIKLAPVINAIPAPMRNKDIVNFIRRFMTVSPFRTWPVRPLAETHWIGKELHYKYII